MASLPENKKNLTTWESVFAISIGIAIPAIAFGRVVFAVLVGVALIAAIASNPWQGILSKIFSLIKSPLGLLVLVIFIFWLPNIYISSYPLRSFEAVIRTLLFVGTGSIFYISLCSNDHLIEIVFRGFILMSLVSAIFCLISMTIPGTNGFALLPELYWFLRLKGWKPELIGTSLKGFSNLSVIIIPILFLAYKRMSRRWKRLSMFAGLAFVIFIWASYNRSALAGLLSIVLVVGIAYSFSSKSIKKGLYRFLGVFLSASLVIVWLWQNRAFRLELQEIAAQSVQGKLFDPKMADLAVYDNVYPFLFPTWLVDFERQVIWKGAIELASASPWFGIGANTINFAPGADQFIPQTNFLHLIPGHPHNWAVELFTETGIVGLAALILAIIFLGISTFKAWLKYKNEGLIVALAIMAGYWGSGLFNFSYWSAWWQASFFISLALSYANNFSSSSKS